MAEWNLDPEWTPQEQINGGEEYAPEDTVSAEDLNTLVENMQHIYRNGGNFMFDPYPTKSFFITTDTVSPASLYGGTWEKIEGKFLFGANSKYSLGAVGGSEDAITVSHQHKGMYFGTKSKPISTQANSPYNDTYGVGLHITLGDNEVYSGDLTNITTNASGESGVGKNMPPFLAVNIWHRIA